MHLMVLGVLPGGGVPDTLGALLEELSEQGLGEH